MIETKLSQLLTPFFDAGYPVIAVETAEERRLLDAYKEMFDKSAIFTIAAAGGLLQYKGENQFTRVDDGATYGKAFQVLGTKKEAFLLAFDFQHVVKNAAGYRVLLQMLPAIKSQGSMVVLISPQWQMPPELKHVIPVIQVPLPSPEELSRPLDVVKKVADTAAAAKDSELLQAARGLTLEQAENVFALAALEDTFPRDIVEREKMRIVKSAYMTVEKPRDIKFMAGLGRLKDYIREEVLPSRDDDQLAVRGILLAGLPGVGKSLSARVIASILGWPLVRFDMSAAKGSLMGQSEAQTRDALSTADAIAPCILWMDEVEKAVGGHSSSGQTDAGVTLGMLGTVLTWMQEHESPVTVIATCNDYAKLPSELTRAGRFDERFFLDLPSEAEREGVAIVHLERLRCKADLADAIAGMTNDWTPAEIEQLVKSAARRTKRQPTLQVLESCAREIIPISKSSNLQQLREWAATNLRKANDLDTPDVKPMRRVGRGK